ncbi:MAG: D-amino acid dehydrogenase [Burkholderiaceae bacterium]|nr:D-amino acid dehydrogenase [Burkholderiaceae bacterium]
MKVIVLGSGILGTASAWFLRKSGHEVTVVERQQGSAQETTFANGCQISVSHSEPWSNPSAPMKILKWLGQEDAPLLYRFRAEKLQWEWGIRFLMECSPSRTAYNIRQCLAMADYSLKTVQAVRAETNIEYDNLTRGIMHFFTDQQDFAASQVGAKLMTSLGCPRQIIDTDEVVRLEPALAPMKDKIVGGDFTPTDESGDAHNFTVGLAKKAAEAGVEFRYGHTATRLLTEGAGAAARIVGVEAIDPTGKFEVLKADAYVVSMGSFAAPFLKPLGIDLMIYPAKGYSATFPVIKPDAAPYVSLIDVGKKLVFSRLGNRLRVGGTAEMNGYGRELNPVRCEQLRIRTRELFPDACDWEQPNFWTGLRPMTPSNIPYIGRAKFANLFLNVGHGTLGWTMGCGSGRAIAEIISGRRPEVDFAFIGV